MGMFGNSAPAGAALYDPSQMTGGDKLAMVGAMLKDAVGAYNGGSSDSVMGLRSMLAQRQLMSSILGSMNGDPNAAPGAPASAPGAPGAAGAPGAPTAAAGPGINPRAMQALAFINPQAARALVEQQKVQGETAVGPNGEVYRKYDPSMVGHVFAAPQAVNNTVVNMNDPANVNRVIPSAPVPGAMPVYDNRGQVVDWQLPRGAQQAIIASQAPTIAHNQAMERIGQFEAGTGRMNAGTQAAAQANTASQNTAILPPGFIPRPRRR